MPKPAITPQTSANWIILEGILISSPEFRYTPAGRLLASLEVEHVSLESGADNPRRIELRIPVLALGTLAELCRLLSQGTQIRVEGSLNQKRWIRDGKVRWGRTEILAQNIKSLDSGRESSSPAAPEHTETVDPVV